MVSQANAVFKDPLAIGSVECKRDALFTSIIIQKAANELDAHPIMNSTN